MGDDLILLSLVSNLRETADITVLSKRPELTAKELSVRAVNRWNPFSILRHVFLAKSVVGGGGGLFQNKTSTRSLFYYLSIILLSKVFFKRVVLLSQGIGPIYGKWPRYFSRRILNLADIITVRDLGSYLELKKLGLKEDSIITADAVFALDFTPFRKENPNAGKVGLVLRKFHDYGFFVEELQDIREDLEINEKIGFTFYPFHLPEDNIITGEIRIKAKLKDLLGEFSNLDLIVGARYHSLLLAYALHKPFIGINVDTKIKYFCETHDMPCLELNKNTFKKNLKSSIIHLIGKKMEFNPEEAGKRVKDSFSLVFED
ncbi:MAG: polysaccharide pyruvyl transferase family protein [Candidatus Firestonebacteria bacterium]